jgi:hypothetical protein
MLNYSYFETLYFRRQSLASLFVINAFKNKSDCCSSMDTVGLRVPIKQIIETFPPLTPVMFQDLSLQQGASRLQTASADLWTFSINKPFPFRIHFPLLNPTEFMISGMSLACCLYYFIAQYLICIPVLILVLDLV